MSSRLLPLLVVSFLAAALCTGAGDALPKLLPDRIKADISCVAGNRLGGRGPGTRGEDLTTDYIANESKKAGL